MHTSHDRHNESTQNLELFTDIFNKEFSSSSWEFFLLLLHPLLFFQLLTIFFRVLIQHEISRKRRKIQISIFNGRQRRMGRRKTFFSSLKLPQNHLKNLKEKMFTRKRSSYTWSERDDVSMSMLLKIRKSWRNSRLCVEGNLM